MKIKHVTQDELEKALKVTNKKYKGNVTWNRFERSGKHFSITLRVKDSSGLGARRGFTGRKLISACWHVHGNFFDNLLNINQDAVILPTGCRIDVNGGNWRDRNIGSIISPLYYSEACDC